MAENNPRSELTPSQQGAIVALLQEPTIRKAAESAGVKERTLYTWLKLPPFRAAYGAARRDVTEHAIAQLQRASSAAANVLVNVMLSAKTPAAVRASTARTVLEFAVKAVELDDLQQQLVALAARLAAVETTHATKA